MRVLLVEPWFGGSHRAWAEGYAAHSAHDVDVLALPDEGWKWRLRGGAITLADQVEERPDIVLASSLLDLAAFLGHARHRIGDVPAALYMHENQLTYPLPQGATRDTAAVFANWSSMVAADGVAWNSDFHRTSWFEAVGPFLDRYPPPTHVDLVPGVAEKSVTLPVGVDLSWIPDRRAKPRPPLVVWNQRWEHDKDPDAVARALRWLADTNVDFRVALCGESPHRTTPASFEALASVLGWRLVHMGHAPLAEYRRLLADASVVVSAAHHEFFGIGVVEAIAAGARPVLPNRLSYPELVGGDATFLYSSASGFVELLARAVAEPEVGCATAVHRFDWTTVAPRYDAWLESLAG